LEDLSFLYLEPEKYEKIKQKVSESRGGRESYIQEFIAEVKILMEKMKVKAEINGRAKHFFSIYQKMTNQTLSFEEIFDLTAVRIIVEEVRDCYTVLGVVHDEWKPIPGRFRDFLAMPKSNGYQSLHTTVVGPAGRMVEIQIRTKEMHRVAEYGVAAHWRYKEGETDEVLDMKMAWLRQMLEWQSELKDAKDFMENLKIDLVVDEVFVFTPKGDVFNLVTLSTPVDFAYRIHTEVGHRCIGAKVNGRIVALDHTLKNGDIIEIITGKRSSPSKDWLNFVKTPGAKVKIKNWFKKFKEEEKIDQMVPVSAKEEKEIKPLLVRKSRVSAKNAVKVSGLENIMIKFSKCCYPIPGEKIIGFVTKGKGIAIHRDNCQNLLHHTMPEEKRVKVEWNFSPKFTFPVEIEIEAFDRVGVLKDVLAQISEIGTNVTGARASIRRGSSAILKVTVDIRDVEHLNQVVAAVRKVSDVYDVLRK
ncbi:MAG: TGS domain-containing protein, partial [Candidatus Margulisiibacteriota bacterium]